MLRSEKAVNSHGYRAFALDSCEHHWRSRPTDLRFRNKDEISRHAESQTHYKAIFRAQFPSFLVLGVFALARSQIFDILLEMSWPATRTFVYSSTQAIDRIVCDHLRQTVSGRELERYLRPQWYPSEPIGKFEFNTSLFMNPFSMCTALECFGTGWPSKWSGLMPK
jgi:hypothetical protein